MKKIYLCLCIFAVFAVSPILFADEEDSAGWTSRPQKKRIAEPGPDPTSPVRDLETPLQDVAYIPNSILESPYAVYADNSMVTLEQLSTELAALKKELKQKADKPDPKKGFTTPKIGGHVLMDSVNVMKQNTDSDEAYGHGMNNFGFREVRMKASGTGYGFLDYKCDLGYEKWASIPPTTPAATPGSSSSLGGVSFKDVFLGAEGIPLFGYLRIGNQYVEDASSEVCAAPTAYTFMEIPSPAGNQLTARRLGITSRHLFHNDQLRFFTGVYGARSVSDMHTILDSNQGVTTLARLTYAPWYVNEGQCMFLLGGYYNYTDYCGEKTKNYVYPGGFAVGINTLDSGYFTCDNYQKVGGEFLWQYYGFAIQGEMFAQYFNNAGSTTPPPDGFVRDGDKTSKGGYVMLRQFLTPGDYRKYSKENATWGTAHVSRNFMSIDRGSFYCLEGPGAWEIATCLGVINNEDFANNTPRCPYGTDYELGLALNWYWNTQTRWSLNYIRQMSDVRVVTPAGTQHYKPATDILGLSCRFFF